MLLIGNSVLRFISIAILCNGIPVLLSHFYGPDSKKLIYQADFRKPLDPHEWIAEIEPQLNSVVCAKNGKLVMDVRGGVTVWLNMPLKGNFQIEYKRRVLIEGKDNDRLSDFNQFWMAQDPRNANLFTRTGVFTDYDSLKLYYVGMGGNSNTTTRFRKYEGNGDKTLLDEYTGSDHLLEADRVYHIKIVLKDNATSFYVDDQCYFIYQDPDPLQEGYFGFRSVHSRQEVWDFRIYSL